MAAHKSQRVDISYEAKDAVQYTAHDNLGLTALQDRGGLEANRAREIKHSTLRPNTEAEVPNVDDRLPQTEFLERLHLVADRIERKVCIGQRLERSSSSGSLSQRAVLVRLERLAGEVENLLASTLKPDQRNQAILKHSLSRLQLSLEEDKRRLVESHSFALAKVKARYAGLEEECARKIRFSQLQEERTARANEEKAKKLEAEIEANRLQFERQYKEWSKERNTLLEKHKDLEVALAQEHAARLEERKTLKDEAMAVEKAAIQQSQEELDTWRGKARGLEKEQELVSTKHHNELRRLIAEHEESLSAVEHKMTMLREDHERQVKELQRKFDRDSNRTEVKWKRTVESLKREFEWELTKQQAVLESLAKEKEIQHVRASELQKELEQVRVAAAEATTKASLRELEVEEKWREIEDRVEPLWTSSFEGLEPAGQDLTGGTRETRDRKRQYGGNVDEGLSGSQTPFDKVDVRHTHTSGSTVLGQDRRPDVDGGLYSRVEKVQTTRWEPSQAHLAVRRPPKRTDTIDSADPVTKAATPRERPRESLPNPTPLPQYAFSTQASEGGVRMRAGDSASRSSSNNRVTKLKTALKDNDAEEDPSQQKKRKSEPPRMKDAEGSGSEDNLEEDMLTRISKKLNAAEISRRHANHSRRNRTFSETVHNEGGHAPRTESVNARPADQQGSAAAFPRNPAAENEPGSSYVGHSFTLSSLDETLSLHETTSERRKIVGRFDKVGSDSGDEPSYADLLEEYMSGGTKGWESAR